MPTPKIELSFRNVPVLGAGKIFNIAHGFVIYTDKNGNEFALRGGPDTSLGKNFWKLKMTAEPYQEGHPDFGKFDRILLYEGADAHKRYKAAKLFFNEKSGQFPYYFIYQNSNTCVYATLDIMGLVEIAENKSSIYNCGWSSNGLCKPPGFAYNGHQLFRGSIDLGRYRNVAGIPSSEAILRDDYSFNESNSLLWNSILNFFNSSSRSHENIKQKSMIFEKRSEFKKQNVNKIYKNMLLELPDGSKTSLQELIEIPFDHSPDGQKISVEKVINELLELKSEEEFKKWQEKDNLERFQTYVARAQIVTMIGVFTNKPWIQKIGISAENIINIGFFLSRAFTGDGTAILNLLSSASSFFRFLRKKDSVDPNKMILNALHHISSQLNDLKLQIIQGNIEIHDEIGYLFETMCDGFQSVYLEIYISRYLTFEKLDHLQNTIHQLSLQVNRQIYDLWLKDLIDARFTLMNYQTRYNQLKHIPDYPNTFENLENIATTFTNWFTNKSGHFNSTGVHLYYEGCPTDKTLTILKNSDPENIIGFLSNYLRYEYQYATSDLSRPVSNPNIWILASSAFMALITDTDVDYFYKKYDPHHNIYKQLLLSAHEILTTYDNIRRNIGLFSLLLDRYRQVIEHSIQASFGELLKIKSLQTERSISEERLREEKSKIVLRSQNFNVQCAFNLSVDKHEPAYSQLVNKLNHWNNVMAKITVPDFFLQYQNSLHRECDAQRISGAPLELFFVTEDNFLLPISVLFGAYPNLSTPLELPQSLLLAERLGIGKFVFKIPAINFIHVSGKYAEESDIKFLNVTFTVAITFEHLGQTIQIATVILRSNPSDHYPIVSQIRNILPIRSKYGKEFGNEFYSGVVNTLLKVVRLSGWLNAKVESFTVNFDPECKLAKQVELEVNKKSLIATTAIATDLHRRTPAYQLSNEKHSGDERYVEAFFRLLNHLDNLDINYYLLLSFAKLAGFSSDTIEKLQRMWNSQYIILLFEKIIGNVEIHRTAQSDVLTILSSIATIKNWIKIHFTEWDDHTDQSPHKIFPIGGVGFLEIAECFREELQLAKDKPHLTHNPSHLVTLECLSRLKDTKTLAQLKIEIDEKWIKENLPLTQNFPLIEIPAENLTKASIQYSSEEIYYLLMQVCEPMNKKVNLQVMPPYLLNHDLLNDDSDDSPVFLRHLFEKRVEQALRTYQKVGVRLVLPICLNHTIDNSGDNLWVTVIAVYDSVRGRKNAVIFMIDPTGNGQSTDCDAVADPLNPYQEEDVLKKSLITSIMTAFSKAAIPIRRFLISGLKQICPHQIENSLPILIANVQAVMRQQILNSRILDNIGELIQEQRQLLKDVQKIESKKENMEEKAALPSMTLIPADEDDLGSEISLGTYNEEDEKKALPPPAQENSNHTLNSLTKTNFSRVLLNKESVTALVGAGVGFFATGGMAGLVIGAAAGLGGKQIAEKMTSTCFKKNRSSVSEEHHQRR